MAGQLGDFGKSRMAIHSLLIPAERCYTLQRKVSAVVSSSLYMCKRWTHRLSESSEKEENGSDGWQLSG